MVEFAYNNFKNASTGHTLFELNCDYHPRVFFKNEHNTYFRSSSANRLVIELRELMNIYRQNLLYTQDLQKQAHDNGEKLCSYTLDEKVWFNSKQIKTK